MSRMLFSSMLVVFLACAARAERFTDDEFSCPTQCLECCEPGWKTFFKGQGGSKDIFKCVLKNANDLPQRDCGKVEYRSATGQPRVHCKYTQEEKDNNLWKSVKSACSSTTQCCCQVSSDWAEEVCLTDVSAQQVTRMSPSKKVLARYELADEQTVDNKLEACLDPNQFAYDYEDWTESGDPGKTKWMSTGCCMKTDRGRQPYTVMTMVPYTTSARTGTAHRSGYRMATGHRKAWTTKYVENVEVCVKWEQRYRCSGGGIKPKEDLRKMGLTPTGKLYRRIPDPGVCMGNKQAQSGLTLDGGSCPGGWTDNPTQVECDCEENCGS